MSLPVATEERERSKFVESTAVANQAGVVVVNADGTNVGGGTVTSIVPGTGATNLGKAEDAAHTSGDVGIMVLAVRNDAGTALAGTTGDYIPLSTDSTGAVRVTGGSTQYAEDAAHSSGDSGTMALAVRKDTPTALAGTDGDYIPLITGSSGQLHIGELFAPVAEDNSNGVIAMVNKPLAVSTYAWSVDKSAALEASSVTKASAGLLRSISGRIDSTHATATYYFQVLNASSLPADGAVTFLIAPLKLNHTNGTDTNFTIDCTVNGVFASTGIVSCLSTTEFTKTISGSFLSTNIFYI